MLQAHSALITALLLVTSVGVAIADGPHDDAGSGQDAGDTPEDALELPDIGVYQGNLTPPDDADWYTLKAGHISTFPNPSPDRDIPACMELGVRSQAAANVTLLLRNGTDRSIEAPVFESQDLRLGIAAPHLRSTFIGLEPRDGLPSFGSYTLDLAAFGPPDKDDGDAGFGRDVGGTPETAADLPGPCLPGVLQKGDADAYNFEANAGDGLVLSLVHPIGPDFDTILIAPDGTQRNLTLQDGDLETVALDQDGTWTLQFVSTGGNTSLYLAGVSIIGDCSTGCLMEQVEEEPKPCRPGCME